MKFSNTFDVYVLQYILGEIRTMFDKKKNFSLFVSLELKGVFQILVALSFLSSAIVIVTKTDSKK